MGCTTSAIWEGTTIHLSYVDYVVASSTTEVQEVNDLRCQLFCAKGGEIKSGCYHHADIVSSCTSFEPTTRQQAGSVVYMLVPHCPTLPSVDG